MDELGAHSLAEILSQHESWHDAVVGAEAGSAAVGDLLHHFATEPLLFVACGSPYFLARSAVTLTMEWLGRPAVAVPSSELLLQPDTVLAPGQRPLMIALSRSGETSETIGAARQIKARGGELIAIGCDAETTLMQMADCVIEIPAGRERSLAQTRSFSGMFLAVSTLLAHLSQRSAAAEYQTALQGLPRRGERFVARARAEIGQFAVDPEIERIIFLGSGVRYGLACEAALKMKEMSLTNSEAFHVLEYRHGPMALADGQALIVGMIGASAPEEELAVLREAHAAGARTLALIEHTPADTTGLDGIFAFDSGLPAPARDLLYLPPAQLLAYERAIAKGVNPDTSRNLAAFIRRPSLAELGG